MEKKGKLRIRIERLRRELYEAASGRHDAYSGGLVLELSQRLDKLLNEYELVRSGSRSRG